MSKALENYRCPDCGHMIQLAKEGRNRFLCPGCATLHDISNIWIDFWAGKCSDITYGKNAQSNYRSSSIEGYRTIEEENIEFKNEIVDEIGSLFLDIPNKQMLLLV